MLALILASLLLGAYTAPSSPAATAAVPSATPAAPSATPAASPAAPIPDGTYQYQFRQGGSSIGASTITVSRAGGTLKVHEVAVLQITYTVDSTLDPATFSTTALHAVYATTPIDITFGGSSYQERAKGQTFTLPAVAGAKGITVLDGPVMTGFFLTPAQIRATGSMTLTGVSAGAAASFACTFVEAPASARPAKVAASDVGYATKGLASGDVSVWADPATLVPQDIEVPSQAISIVLVPSSKTSTIQEVASAVPTPLPTAVPHFTGSDVTFVSHDGTKLSGTLTVPEHLVSRMPAVVLVHGSGPQTRDEQVGPNPIFLELSNALSNDGFVVLRYDKRGIGKSGGRAGATTRGDLLADARAAIAFLQRQPNVDAHRIFVVGHSEGGELAPSLAADGAPLRGIALMAPPAIPLEQILVQQESRGLTGAAKAKAVADSRKEIAAIKAGKAMPFGMGPWLRSSFGIDPAQVITKVPCPILILQGGKDFQVLAKDLPRLVNAAKAAHRDIAVHVFPNDDHLFITVPTGKAAVPAEYLAPHRVDPAMIGALLSWLKEKM
jgi:dienelactone hydrolase